MADGLGKHLRVTALAFGNTIKYGWYDTTSHMGNFSSLLMVFPFSVKGLTVVGVVSWDYVDQNAGSARDPPRA